MPTKFSFILAVASIMVWAPPTFARINEFEGLWGVIGGKVVSESSASTVSYDYADKYAGSLNPPGFTKKGTYDLKASETPVLPSVRLLYVYPTRFLLLGFSVSGDYHQERVLKSEVFDFTVPTNQPDRARGYSMWTKLRPALDYSAALEPGFGITRESMIYAKIAYHWMTGTYETKSSVTTGLFNPVFTEATSSLTFTGLGFGGGLRFLYRNDLFLEAQAESVTFAPVKANASTLTSTSDELTMTQTQDILLRWTTYSISLGARF